VPWGAGLAILDLPNIDPVDSMDVLRYVGIDTFRVVRADDSLAEEITFQRDKTGRITGYKRWSQWYPRVNR
jgi:hypothetical protein